LSCVQFPLSSLSRAMATIRKKLVFVGDMCGGKTALIIAGSQGTFPEAYIPTVQEVCLGHIVVDGTPVELALWDTAGTEVYHRLRALSYPDTDAVVILYAIDSPDSLENIAEKVSKTRTFFSWGSVFPEFRDRCSGMSVHAVPRMPSKATFASVTSDPAPCGTQVEHHIT